MREARKERKESPWARRATSGDLCKVSALAENQVDIFVCLARKTGLQVHLYLPTGAPKKSNGDRFWRLFKVARLGKAKSILWDLYPQISREGPEDRQHKRRRSV